MASQLEKLARAVRELGDRSSPVRQVLDASASSTRRAAGQVPRGVPSAAQAAHALQLAARSLAEAQAALADFEKQADRFAERLVGAGSHAAGLGKTLVVGVALSFYVGSFPVPNVEDSDLVESMPAMSSLIQLSGHARDGAYELLEREREAQDSMEEVPAPLSAEHRPPPPGNTFHF